MKDTNITHEELSFDEFDEINSPRKEDPQFDAVVDAAISRRSFLSGVLTFGAGTFLMGTSSLVNVAEAATDRFGFTQVAASTADTITVPEGYKWDMLVKWGDPLWSDAPEFDEAKRGTAASQLRAFGDNNDGISMFAIGNRHVLVAKNEYTNRPMMYCNRESGLPETADDVAKGKAAHGLTVAEVHKVGENWEVIKDSDLNRRITADTPMELTGPAAGHDLLKTTVDPAGTLSLGTWNNCDNEETPWGTYLACEENFNGYFSSSDKNLVLPQRFKRYGIGHDDWGYN